MLLWFGIKVFVQRPVEFGQQSAPSPSEDVDMNDEEEVEEGIFCSSNSMLRTLY